MAFHVACPITCRRICFCELGFPRRLQNEKGKIEFVDEVSRIEEFIKDPWLLRADANSTVQVKVPKVSVLNPPPPLSAVPKQQTILLPAIGDGCDVDEAALAVSAQTKRVALQKKAAASSLVAEDYARRFESGDVALGAVKDDDGEVQGLSSVKIMCRLCFGGENQGSERARKMLPCKSCGKKYHRSCLKSWAQHRDLFHWSLWTCPSCRICEVCRRTGDPNKFMFCKRCDGAYHCYCQHPPHKNVGSGPYLCPKHTKCHSCASTVPGNGLSVRWFLGYTCCDACGRLFVKGNYCPVCLKVYRDSEATPMVCCDVCQRWVHCQCDGISDDKYAQFQADGNLQYVCPTCRGECYQVRNLEEAVQELWRRKDEADKDLIASLRAAAGLPSQEEIFSISPFSDDEENGPAVLKNEYGRSLKLSLKGLVDKSSKKNKKKSSKKKSGKKKGNQLSLVRGAEVQQSYEGHDDASSFGYASVDNRNEHMQPSRSGEPDGLLSPVAGSLTDGMSPVNHSGVLKHKLIDEVIAGNINQAPRTVKIKKNKLQGGLSIADDAGNQAGASKTSKGPKIVIHLGGRSKSMASSPRSDASSFQKEQDLTPSNGSEDVAGPRLNDCIDKQDTAAKFGHGKAAAVDQMKGSKPRGKEGNIIKIRKAGTEVTDVPPKFSGATFLDATESGSAVGTRSSLGKRGSETAAVRMNTDLLVSRANKLSSTINDDNIRTPSLLLTQKEPKLLKLKFKNPITDNHSSWAPKEEAKSFVKGQRSKRKRPSPLREKAPSKGDDGEGATPLHDDSSMDEIMDANWILQKLGKDAIGKRVEVHQPSDNSWNKGTVTGVFEGTSTVSVALDNGKNRSLELGKQGIRFISQKQKRR